MESDRDITATALHMRANWIETGNPCLSAEDALDHRRAWERDTKYESRSNPRPPLPKKLTDEQKELVARLRALTNRRVS